MPEGNSALMVDVRRFGLNLPEVLGVLEGFDIELAVVAGGPVAGLEVPLEVLIRGGHDRVEAFSADAVFGLIHFDENYVKVAQTGGLLSNAFYLEQLLLLRG